MSVMIGDHLSRGALLLFLIAAPMAIAAPCPATQPRKEEALIELEQRWAKALEQQDTGALTCILADEFQDADIHGALHDRREALARAAQPRHGANHLEELRARIYGDTGFARGINRVLDTSGKVIAMVRFTDIFVYRDGRWQAVAGQETLVGDSK